MIAWLVGIAVALLVAELLGLDVAGWLSDLWDQIKAVPVGYIVAGVALQTAQTFFAGLSYYGILRAAYPNQVELMPIVAAYAVGVAMNGFLPANIGTFVTLLMFVAIIPAATFAGSMAAYLVQKIFFTIAGTFVYLYLFLSVPGSFNENLGNITDNPALTILIVVGGGFLIVLLGRIFWKQVKKLWEKAKQGGAILAHPKQYLTRAFLPSFASWLCKLAVIGVFLAAFAIPVTFESIMWVAGSGSLANVASFTPGAVGITQATNALALDQCCDVPRDTAIAYSTAQQLIITAWNVGLALVLTVVVFGWTGGKLLVTQSYADAKDKVAEQKDARAAREAGGEAGREGRGVTTGASASYGEAVTWQPERPRFKPIRLLISWALTGASLWIAAAILPGVDIAGTAGALAVAAVVAVLNAVLPPVLAALRLPFMIALGFVLVLVLNAVVLKLASDLLENTFTVDNFGWALLAALVVAAASVVLDVIFGTNDDDTYTLRVVQRIAKRQGGAERTDVPGIVFLEIDGLALPVLRRAMRDGNTPNMARWVAEGTHELTGWEPDLSSQTGASQAGILLGSNDDIPAFRWVDKESGLLTACSAPDDCAKIERDRATGIGLLIDGGTSRGNLLSGEADEVILTVSRIEAEKRANPGYRAFFANGFNVTRALVLFFWELVLEWTAALRAIRRDVRPRGHRGGVVPVHARSDVRDRPRPDRLRRAHGHDARTPGRLRDLLELRRGRPPLGPGAQPTRSRRCASSTSSSRASTGRGATRPGRTSSSSCPTTVRPRERRSSSGTATAWTSWSSARSHGARSPASRAATSSTRWSRMRSARRRDGPTRRSARRRTCPTASSWCSARGTWG